MDTSISEDMFACTKFHVSMIHSIPSTSARLRRGLWKYQVSQISDDVSEDIESIRYPKIPSQFADNFNTADILALWNPKLVRKQLQGFAAPVDIKGPGGIKSTCTAFIYLTPPKRPLKQSGQVSTRRCLKGHWNTTTSENTVLFRWQSRPQPYLLDALVL